MYPAHHALEATASQPGACGKKKAKTSDTPGTLRTFLDIDGVKMVTSRVLDAAVKIAACMTGGGGCCCSIDTVPNPGYNDNLDQLACDFGEKGFSFEEHVDTVEHNGGRVPALTRRPLRFHGVWISSDTAEVILLFIFVFTRRLESPSQNREIDCTAR